MTILLAYLISFFIGFLTIHAILQDSKMMKAPLRLSLSLGLGLGISSILTFFSFLMFNGFHRFTVIGINIVCLLALSFFCYSKKKLPSFENFFTKNIFRPSSIGLILGGAILSGCLYFLFQRYPFGGWDAWALYNTKTKFLILNGADWTVIFDKLHPYTQPDYPLLLPFINTWIYAVAPGPIHHITLATAFVFTLNSGFLIFAGLYQFTRKRIAFLASFLLLLIPHFILLGSSQYADILLAFYLCAATILTMLTIREKNDSIAILAGLVMGLLTFTKNEGIVMAILLTGMICLYLVFEKIKNQTDLGGLRRLLSRFFIGLIVTFSACLIFKLFLAPPNPDILPGTGIKNFEFLNLKGLTITLSAVIAEIVNLKWGLIWCLILFMVLPRFSEFFQKENKVITFFFLTYFCILIFIYLTTINFDLSWRLRSTLSRIYFYLLPSILFFCCYVCFKNDPTST